MVVEDPAAAVGEAVPIDGEVVALSVDFGAADSRADGGDRPGYEDVACEIAVVEMLALARWEGRRMRHLMMVPPAAR